MDDDPKLHRVSLYVCALCLDGEGGECHVPGCAFWMHAAPIGDPLDVLREYAIKPTESDRIRATAEAIVDAQSDDSERPT